VCDQPDKVDNSEDVCEVPTMMAVQSIEEQ